MGKKIVLVDTDIFIKVFRGDEQCKYHLDGLKDRIGVSVITFIELYQGVNSKKRKYDLEKQFKAYHLLHLNESISNISLSLIRKHLPNNKNHLLMASLQLLQFTLTCLSLPITFPILSL